MTLLIAWLLIYIFNMSWFWYPIAACIFLLTQNVVIAGLIKESLG